MCRMPTNSSRVLWESRTIQIIEPICSTAGSPISITNETMPGFLTTSIGTLLSGGSPSPAGFACLILASAMWAVYTLRFQRSGLAPIQAAALICFWSAVLFLPAYLLFDLVRLGSAPVREVVVQTIYQG